MTTQPDTPLPETSISLDNGLTYTRDASDLTPEQYEYFTATMPDHIRERLHNRISPCSPAEFLSAYLAEPYAISLVLG